MDTGFPSRSSLEYTIGKEIRQYDYFDYAVNEALFLSGKEETLINDIVQHIKNEYNGNMDRLSHGVIIAQLELLLIYAERFYQRQFMTRRIASHQMLSRLEDLLNKYFNSPAITNDGLPSVRYIAEQLNISPGYLSSLLKSLTGQNTQQHLHNKLIEVAKQKLSTTNLSVSEIAYELGFEHLASFSKLFKAKTKVSPQDFRASFN
ncbi:helix-turn-helix transcriptional regulator [Chitinophaga pinensis]|uniref:helix-turn-helix domain-containing protein n=1 Tax=Chitinophaga pinensis TaxID=79329 RepID=UPI0028F6D3D2|nr:helix-turn-helix transcriptional regulator [Chitinophaga pinensis]